MFRDDPDLTEYVSIVGTDAFLDFVESIRSEGVELDKVPMSDRSTPKKPLLVEVDRTNSSKDLDTLDIPVPKLSSRIVRRMKNLDELDPATMPHPGLPVKQFTAEQQRHIVFKDLDTDEFAHTTDLGEEIPATPQAVLAYLSTEIMRRLRLVGGQDVLFGKLKTFVRDYLFATPVDLDDPNILRNLSEVEARRAILDTFTSAINELTIVDEGSAQVVSEIKLATTRPVVVGNQAYVTSDKTVFNRIVGDSQLELEFAKFLDDAKDVTAFAKNTRSIHFFIEYVNAAGDIAHYYPDFLVRTKPDLVWVVETKGLEDVDVAPKWHRLVQWCEDATGLDPHGRTFQPLFVPEDDFHELMAGHVTTMGRLADALAEAAPAGTA